MDAANEGVGWCIAFSVFDLQINCPQFTLMRFAPHNLTRFQAQALILVAGLSARWSQVSAPVPFCCLTHDRDLLILFTAVIPLLGAVPAVAWHTHAQTHKKYINILEALTLKGHGKQLELSSSKCVGQTKGV